MMLSYGRSSEPSLFMTEQACGLWRVAIMGDVCTRTVTKTTRDRGGDLRRVMMAPEQVTCCTARVAGVTVDLDRLPAVATCAIQDLLHADDIMMLRPRGSGIPALRIVTQCGIATGNRAGITVAIAA